MAVSSAPSRGQHVPALDGVRGLAILAVMIFHLYSPIGSWTTLVTAYGTLGVNLFFSLSGFLITGILLDAKDRPGYFKNFYARRALRIWPLYYGTLFVLLVLVPFAHPIHDEKYRFSIDHQVWLWLYLNNFYEAHTGRAMPLFGHFWSLAVEEQFYFIWPILVLILSKRGLLWTCAVCMIASFACRLGLLLAGMDPAIVIRVTFCELDSLAVGAALSVILREESTLERLRTLGLVALTCALLFTSAQFVVPVTANGIVGKALAGTVWSMAFGGVLISARGVYGAGWVHFYEARLLRFLGKYSYGIYVFHWPIGRIFSASFPKFARTESLSRALASALCEMAISISFAFVSWHVFEKRFLLLKRFFATPSTPGSV